MYTSIYTQNMCRERWIDIDIDTDRYRYRYDYVKYMCFNIYWNTKKMFETIRNRV